MYKSPSVNGLWAHDSLFSWFLINPLEYVFPYFPDSLILSLSPCLSSLQVSSLVSRVTTFFSSSSRDNLTNQRSARVTVSQSEGSLQNTPVAADFPLQVCDLVSVHKVTGLIFAIIYGRLMRELSVIKKMFSKLTLSCLMLRSERLQELYIR